MDWERRVMPAMEMRVEDTDDGPVIRGHAVVFDSLSVMLWGFREKIKPGAFSGSIADGDVRALWQHDQSRPLGRVKAGTLRVFEDDDGVGFELKAPDTQVGRDAVVSIRRGDVDQMSFGFSVLPDGEEWGEDEDGVLIRSITGGTLHEISPVTFPAYPQTSAGIRSVPTGDGAEQDYSDIYGFIPEIPVELRAQDAGQDEDADQMRAQAVRRGRILRLKELAG